MSIDFENEKLMTLSDLELSKAKVLMRVDLNTPIEDGKVSDDTRIRAILPTLEYLFKQNAKVTLISHLGRPQGKPNKKYSLMPVAERLATLIQKDVLFPEDCVGDAVKKLEQQQDSTQVVLLENLRYHKDEEANDPIFAKKLKGQHTIFITDAFGVLHRAHASTDSLPKLFEKKAVGLLIEKELSYLYPLVSAPKHPFSVVLGGAKISDKIKVVEQLIKKVDRLFIGGAMVFTFLKAKGFPIGKSLFEPDMVSKAKRILEDASRRNVSVFFPKDFQICASKDDLTNVIVSATSHVPDDHIAFDIGPRTVEHFKEFLAGSEIIFWNGPMGWFEQPPFNQGTNALAHAIAKMTSIKIIGGGDSAAAAEKAGLAHQFDHISTGGGATLEFLEDPMLPGLKSMLTPPTMNL